jgi:methylglutaconyl-CoA hydratase
MHLFHSSSPILPFIRSRFIIPLFPQLHHQHQRTFISTPPSLKSISIPDADIDIPPPTPSPCSLLKVTNIPAPHSGHIRILSLNSPRNRNALSRQLVKELRYELKKLKKKKKNEKKTNEAQGLSRKKSGKRAEDVVEEDDDDDDVREGDFKIRDFYTEGFRDDDTRCLILASELDNAFCSGADLKERRDMSRNE